MADGSQHFALAEPFAAEQQPAIVVLFAGAGGTSIAAEEALGRGPDAALNHDDWALGVHKRNYGTCEHYQADALETDPRVPCFGRRIGLLWLSPDCRHFSPAKGSAIVSKRVRALAWAAIPWLKLRRPDVMMLENVEAFLTWGPTIIGADGKERPDKSREGETFRLWLKRVRQCGYHVEWRVEPVADHGGHTIRKRLKIIARCDGLPIIWPEATHAHRAVAAKRGLRPHRPAYEIIDFARPIHSIFISQAEADARGLKIRRPLKEATLRRIAKGLFRFTLASTDPFILPITHSGDDRAHDVRESLRTITGAHRGEFAVVAPHMTAIRNGSIGRDLRDSMLTATANSFHKKPGGAIPLGLVSAQVVGLAHGDKTEHAIGRGSDLRDTLGTMHAGGGHHGLLAAFMEQANTDMVGHDMRESVSTIVAKGCTQRVVAAQLTQFRGSNEGGGADLGEALLSPTAGGQHQALLETVLEQDVPMSRPFSERERELRAFLVKYYGSASATDLHAPLDTATSRARFGLVVVQGHAYRITDICMRMLDPETELSAAMGVPRSYVLNRTADGRVVSKTRITHHIGNMVARQWAARLIAANCNHLAAPGHVYREAA